MAYGRAMGARPAGGEASYSAGHGYVRSPGYPQVMAEDQGREEDGQPNGREEPTGSERLFGEQRSMTLVGYHLVGEAPPDALLPPPESTPAQPTTPTTDSAPSITDSADAPSQTGE